MKRILIILNLLFFNQTYCADTKNLEVEYQGQLFGITIERTTRISEIRTKILDLINTDSLPLAFWLELFYCKKQLDSLQKIEDIDGLWENPRISLLVEGNSLNVSTISKPNFIQVGMHKFDSIFWLKRNIIKELRAKGLYVGPVIRDGIIEYTHTDLIRFIFNGSEISDGTLVRDVDGLWENPNVTITISER